MNPHPVSAPEGSGSSEAATSKDFRQQLLGWHRRDNNRLMPWKGERDPYRIWLSEVILQQTRVEQGWKYYENFIAAFPDLLSLAAAPQEQVYKLWEGLGYYSRCANLIRAARKVAEEYNGVFPATYEGILSLPGVGPYTAAAIAAFAFDLPHAVLDGNVFRVLSRVYNDETPTDTTAGKKRFAALAEQTLDREGPAAYNQAIMDFGATVCRPVPRCAECFYQHDCRARLAGRQDELPVKEKKTRVRERWFHYLVLQSEGCVLVHQRTTGDIWSQLWEFYLLETGAARSQPEVLRMFAEQTGLELKPEGHYETTQRLSHQRIHFRFLRASVAGRPEVPGFVWMNREQLSAYALPQTLKKYWGEMA